MALFQRILVASDFSEASGKALEVAVAMARESGAALHVIHVCEVPLYTDAPIDLVTPLAAAAEARLDKLLASLRDVCPGAKAIFKMGAPWEQILGAAGELGADVIVLGTHGRRGVPHAIMGSVAERVVRLSEVPVLTVRSRLAAHGAAR